MHWNKLIVYLFQITPEMRPPPLIRALVHVCALAHESTLRSRYFNNVNQSMYYRLCVFSLMELCYLLITVLANGAVFQ